MAVGRHILILKTGAAGDVVRTTSLLPHFINDTITWLTATACIPLFDLPGAGNLNVYAIDDFPKAILSTNFDLVLSLEEDEYCAKLASQLVTKKITGVYWNNGLAYTNDAKAWFDMSLISVYGNSIADTKKRANAVSYQAHLFGMLQLPFCGECYTIKQPNADRHPLLIGIEKTAGHRWPNKGWYNYEGLSHALQESGYQTVFFERQHELLNYMKAIDGCSLLVSGDTLAMHLAMAYRIPVVALFNCTSPAEIYDYGLLKKVISPLLGDYFYSTTFDPAAISALDTASVLAAVETHWLKYYESPVQIKAHIPFSGYQS